MYLRILKNDLRRKKTMNIILLLFVILSSMFASSSMNNIVTVMNGTDYYLDKADMGDYFIVTMQKDAVEKLSSVLDNTKAVDSYKYEDIMTLTSGNFKRDGKKLTQFTNAAILQSADDLKINIFNMDNNKIETVPEGKCYISATIPERAGLEVGDKFTIDINGNTYEFEFAGRAKDALLGSEFVNNPRFIMNKSDYEKISSENPEYKGNLFYIKSSDTEAVEAATADTVRAFFSGSRSLIKTSYVMNMIIAGILLIISVALIIVSFVVLRFTIGFTIREEFREIGVMKAIGLKNRSVRGLYLIKYLGIAIIGSAIGLAFGIPFGKMLLDSVSKSMVLGNDSGLLVSVISSIAVVLIISAFSWRCTHKIKKMSPVDAVRSGQTGERFKKRSILSLSRSRMKTTPFMAVNDVLSAKKQFGIITAVFTVCILMVTLLANTANTLSSDSLMYLLGTTKSDLYYNGTDYLMEVLGGSKSSKQVEDEIKQILKDNGYEADVTFERWASLSTEFEDKKAKIPYLFCPDTKTTDYYYSKGKAPMYTNEIALSNLALEKLGAEIGDTVVITIDDEEKEFLITGSFTSFNNLGTNGRFHQDIDISDSNLSSAFAFQIDFADNPDEKEIEKRKEDLKDIFETDNVYNAQGFVMDCMGGSANAMEAMKNLILIIDIIIVAMIAVLMERSFISKERAEIALMKAMGIKSKSIIGQHTLRFVIVSLAAAILAAALCLPLTNLAIDPVFGIMGAVDGVEYTIKPLEVFVSYPLIILAATALSAFLTALYTKTVKASDTANIE